MSPIYEFVCPSCGEETERLIPMSERNSTPCLKCAGVVLDRLVSRNTGFTLRGPGFFCNDYPKHG